MTAVLRDNPKSAGAYALGFVILAAVYAARFSAFATVGEAVYAFSAILLVAVALVAGGLALQRYRAEQRDGFLLISAGLWVAAALHLYHFAAYAGVFGSAESQVAAASVQRGVLFPTLLFTLFLALSLLASRQDRPSTAQPGGVFLAAATLAFIVTVASLVFPVPPPADVVRVLGQPFVPLAAQPELLLAAALTVIGIAGILRTGNWRAQSLDRWLLIAFIVTLAALARFPILYAWQLEGLLLPAQGLILASYLCVAAGTVLRSSAPKPFTSVKTLSRDRRSLEPDQIPKAQENHPERTPEFALYALETSHRALRNATDGLLVGLRADGTITDWKPAADFGPTTMPSDALGENIRTVLPTAQADAIVAAVARVLQAGKTEELEYTAADGSVALGGYVTPHSSDQALCIIRDHTALAQALQEREEQRQAAEALRRVTGDWLIRISRAGAIQDLQPPAATEPASYADMFAGKQLQDVFQGDDVTPLVAAAEAALASGEVQELSYLRQSGQVLAVRVAAYGENSALCLLRDITELREATAQLLESEETNQELRAHLERLTAEQAGALDFAETSARALRSLLPDLVFRVRADGTILECKPAESFGPQEVDGIVGAKAREVLPVDLASQIMAAIERVRSEAQPQRFTCHPVGGQVLAGGIAALVDDQFLCVVRDQTQQKQMETALAQQAAVLAQEMQAKLEEESLRALRTENDVLRAHLLRVAQVALEVGAAPIAAAPESKDLEAGGASPSTAQATVTRSSPNVATPASTQESPEIRPDPSSPPPTQAASDASRPAQNVSREVDTLANGESPQHGAAADTGGSPRNSAAGPAAGQAVQAQTAVATQQETLPQSDTSENGQEERTAAVNGEPMEETRPS